MAMNKVLANRIQKKKMKIQINCNWFVPAERMREKNGLVVPSVQLNTFLYELADQRSQ